MSAVQFIQAHGPKHTAEIVKNAPSTATHFTEALGGHYAKEALRNNELQWAWFNTIVQAWYYDFASKERVQLSELRILVKSVERINRFEHGIQQAKNHLNYLISFGSEFAGVSKEEVKELAEDINNYESIYGTKNHA